MRFYNQPHAFYAGVDLHARTMFTHVLDSAGATVFARDLPARPDAAPLAAEPGLPAGAGTAAKATLLLRRSSSPSCLAGTWHGEVAGAPRRAQRQSRRRLGTGIGPTPYSCLVPPRQLCRCAELPTKNHPGAEARRLSERLLNVANLADGNDCDTGKLTRRSA